jgi:hypothetical protein
MSDHLSLSSSILAALLTASLPSAFAQTPATPPAQTPAAQDTSPTTDRLHNSVATNTQEAWEMLTSAVQDPKHSDLRT